MLWDGSGSESLTMEVYDGSVKVKQSLECLETLSKQYAMHWMLKGPLSHRNPLVVLPMSYYIS